MLAILLFQMSKLIIRVPPKESLQLNDISELPSFCLFSKAGFLRRRRMGGPTDFHCNIASSRKSLQIPGGGDDHTRLSLYCRRVYAFGNVCCFPPSSES